jgi:RNA polymerase sigma factor (sigma-70 family)
MTTVPQLDDLSQFWQANRAALMRLCRRWSDGNQADAEDLLGDAYLRALEARASAPAAPARPLAWWSTIIANSARDRARRGGTRARAVERLRVEWYRLSQVPPSAPDEQFVLRHRIRAVRLQISALNAQQKAALTLRTSGFGYDEIGRALGVSTPHARKLVQLARAVLRRPGP